jgi:hypothetical protein
LISFSLEPRGPGHKLLRGRLTGGCLAIGGVGAGSDSAQRSPRSAPAAAHLSFVSCCRAELTALNLLPSTATLAFASRPILRHKAAKLRADLLTAGPLCFAEIGDGFVIRNEPVPSATSLPDCGQPHAPAVARLTQLR